MVQAIDGTASTRLGPTVILPQPPEARQLVEASTVNGRLDAAKLASRLADAAQNDPAGGMLVHLQVEARLTPVQRGELARAESVMSQLFGNSAPWAGSQPVFQQIDPQASGLGSIGMPNGQGVTADQLRQIMPNACAQAYWYAGPLNQAMAAHGITTPEQRAAFLAQIAVESGQLQHTSENLNYSAQRLTQVWPSRFPTTAVAQPYAHNAEALGNRVYADRLGNGNEASGDGYQFRGRGLVQVTGRENYRRVGYETNPEALGDAGPASDTAAAFWQNNGLDSRTGRVLNRAEFNGISRTVNGGDNGSGERWTAYQRALTALQVPH